MRSPGEGWFVEQRLALPPLETRAAGLGKGGVCLAQTSTLSRPPAPSGSHPGMLGLLGGSEPPITEGVQSNPGRISVLPPAPRFCYVSVTVLGKCPVQSHAA